MNPFPLAGIVIPPHDGRTVEEVDPPTPPTELPDFDRLATPALTDAEAPADDEWVALPPVEAAVGTEESGWTGVELPEVGNVTLDEPPPDVPETRFENSDHDAGLLVSFCTPKVFSSTLTNPQNDSTTKKPTRLHSTYEAASL